MAAYDGVADNGKPSCSSASPIAAVLNFWKDFDLEGERAKLDEQGLKITKNQETSLKNRRKLDESTGDFKNASTEEKLKLFNSLLKAYEEEVDNLTKRATFGENSFLNIYLKLLEAPDPCPALVSATELASKVTEVESENNKMKHKLEEYRAEAAHLNDQQASIRRLEEHNRLLEQQAGPASTLVKAAMPWSSRRGALSRKNIVLKTVKGILNKLSPEKYYVLKDQLISAGIISADILEGVVSLIFEKAVLEPTSCPMYAELCLDLSTALPQFPSDEPDGKPIAFRRILLNICQEAFEGAENMRNEIKQMTAPDQESERRDNEKMLKLRTLGNIRLIGELFKQKMIPEKIVHHCVRKLLGVDAKATPAEENVEALCQLFNTVGKQLEANPKSRILNDSYFVRMKEQSDNPNLPSWMRVMVCDVLDLRTNKWIPRREEFKAKITNEIHSEAEQKLGLRPGTTNMRNGRGSSGMGFGYRSNFGIGRSWVMMPGMSPQKMSNMSVTDTVEREGLFHGQLGGKNEGLMSSPAVIISQGHSQASVVRPSVGNPKLLPQGSVAFLSGKPSALQQNSTGWPLLSTVPNVGAPEPGSQSMFEGPRTFNSPGSSTRADLERDKVLVNQPVSDGPVSVGKPPSDKITVE